ncbi:MAG: L,D-transpeptidase family protein, partial [Chitinophagales bacterium]
QRIDQIKMNMERWRWLPQSLGSRYVLVNIPAYWLYVYEPNEVIGLEKKVMVGKTYHKTPVFNDLMQYIEFNPYWTVPYSIASREILPKLKRNPGYLAAKDMRLFQGSKSVNPYNVDWSSVYRSNFKYKIRQNPGPKNALGTMKFMFPNLYNVYVHDTPSKSLFVESQRAYSHGCVRLEKPIEFAEYLLKDNKNYTLNKIEKVLDKGKNKRVNLEEALPIYILYFTVWADEEGNPRFMHDIYGKDAEVLQMLGGM